MRYNRKKGVLPTTPGQFLVPMIRRSSQLSEREIGNGDRSLKSTYENLAGKLIGASGEAIRGVAVAENGRMKLAGRSIRNKAGQDKPYRDRISDEVSGKLNFS